MKKKLAVIGGLVLALGLSACSTSSSEETNDFLDKLNEMTETKFETVEVNSLYSLDLPEFMTSTTQLNDEASLQYNNLYKEKYVIVIDESKEEFVETFKELNMYDESKSIIDNYAEAQSAFISEGATVLKESDFRSAKANGLEMRMKDIDADVTGVPESVSYFLGFVEGKETLYMVMAWTLKSRKDGYEEEAGKIIKSLKEM